MAFVGTSNYPPEELFELLMDSNVKFESLHLMYFLTPVTLPRRYKCYITSN